MKLSTCVLLAAALSARAADHSYHPRVIPAEFRTTIDHPFCPFPPGTCWTYLEKSGGATSTNVVTATRDTAVVMGVTCVVVHETVARNRRIAEENYTWVAQHEDRSVWCFGTAAKETSPAGRVSIEGSWEAGVKDAQPGVLMPGNPRPGKPYRQEYLHNVAENMAQIVATNETVTTTAGTFTGCLKTREWSMLEAGTDLKWYAPGIGLVKEISTNGDSVVLVSITHE